MSVASGQLVRGISDLGAKAEMLVSTYLWMQLRAIYSRFGGHLLASS